MTNPDKENSEVPSRGSSPQWSPSPDEVCSSPSHVKNSNFISSTRFEKRDINLHGQNDEQWEKDSNDEDDSSRETSLDAIQDEPLVDIEAEEDAILPTESEKDVSTTFFAESSSRYHDQDGHAELTPSASEILEEFGFQQQLKIPNESAPPNQNLSEAANPNSASDSVHLNLPCEIEIAKVHCPTKFYATRHNVKAYPEESVGEARSEVLEDPGHEFDSTDSDGDSSVTSFSEGSVVENFTTNSNNQDIDVDTSDAGDSLADITVSEQELDVDGTSETEEVEFQEEDFVETNSSEPEDCLTDGGLPHEPEGIYNEKIIEEKEDVTTNVTGNSVSLDIDENNRGSNDSFRSEPCENEINSNLVGDVVGRGVSELLASTTQPAVEYIDIDLDVSECDDGLSTDMEPRDMASRPTRCYSDLDVAGSDVFSSDDETFEDRSCAAGGEEMGSIAAEIAAAESFKEGSNVEIKSSLMGPSRTMDDFATFDIDEDDFADLCLLKKEPAEQEEIIKEYHQARSFLENVVMEEDEVIFSAMDNCQASEALIEESEIAMDEVEYVLPVAQDCGLPAETSFSKQTPRQNNNGPGNGRKESPRSSASSGSTSPRSAKSPSGGSGRRPSNGRKNSQHSKIEMEERVAGGSSSSSNTSSGGRDKKYVLYTVVGDDRARTTPGAWMIRIVLGSLMIVALAVVPYVSLRLAQANSRTLVVFQPVPLHNRSALHHSTAVHKPGVVSALRSDRTVKLMQVADLTLENYTATLSANETRTENSSALLTAIVATDDTPLLNGTTVGPLASVEVTSINTSVLVTLHESDVTIAVLEDKNISSSVKPAVYVNKTIAENTELPSQTETTPDSLLDNVDELTTTAALKVVPDSTQTSSDPLQTVKPTVSLSSSDITASSSVAAAKSTSSSGTQTTTLKPSPKTAADPNLPEDSLKKVKPTTESPAVKSFKKKVSQPKRFSSAAPIQKALSHKLVYVATSASGNHVGGICVWKVDKNVTDWSYFYDNIPIEFQSGHDAGDHELRATLAAARTWSGLWQDAHTTLRSQHNAIEHSDLAVRKVLVDELEKMSDGHFTYELEWRLPEADTLVKIASSLSRLHQDYKFWFQDFKTHVDELLGKQNWETAVSDKHVKVADEAFFTDENLKVAIAQPEKLSENTPAPNAIATTKPKVKSPRSLSHKLVYVATSASGNHVGGFCMWKVDKNVTNWSYFYDNIPVEYQSNHDSADHEQRATLAAVRTWADRWQDAHVTLRSQHAAIDRSETPIRKVLVDTLERLSDGHFTYDLEWRLRKSDDLVKISFSLSRLHRNFAHWFAVFKASVDDVLGPQDWDVATRERRVTLTDKHFYTEEARPQVDQGSLQSTLAELEN